MKLTIGYVGLSHLGINYAIASAIKGFNVVCYDDDKNIISSLKKKKIPFYEKNLVLTPICRPPATIDDMNDVVNAINKVIQNKNKLIFAMDRQFTDYLFY